MRYLLLFLFAILPSAVSALDITEGRLDTDQQDAVASGDIVVDVWRDEARDDRAIDVLGVLNINAPAEVLWNVMTDCDRSETIVPDMKSCVVVESGPDGRWDIREQKTRVNFLISHTSRFRSDYDPYRSITISGAGGDMKVQNGIWELKALANNVTQLTYRATSAPSFPVSKSKMIETSQEKLPLILANLRREAEADFQAMQ